MTEGGLVNDPSDDVKEKTKKIAELYFKGIPGERPFEMWKAFDKELAKEVSLFFTGKLYAREKIPHTTRQLVTVAALTVLERSEELKIHLQAALNVGCKPQEVAEVIFQMATYGGVPVMNSALKIFREVLREKGLWPLK
jgi:4-carboxymuconolactone decarboxylase